MNEQRVTAYIVDWLKNKLKDSSQKGFVVGVSGGVDSAVTSTLCALTSYPVAVVSLPLIQEKKQLVRSLNHMNWLTERFTNVKSFEVDLSNTFFAMQGVLPPEASDPLSMANLKSRLRMCALYAFANSNQFLVAGTGNKVEDYGIGFFTKYGDGGVDISPIADLLKSEVYSLAKYLEVDNSIVTAPPTDGLWPDNRTDEQQIGATYSQLEWALNFHDLGESDEDLSNEQKEVLALYRMRHQTNSHKMEFAPTCQVPEEIK